MPPETNSQFPNSTPPILNQNKKDPKFILLLILGLILIAINLCFVYKTYFQNTEIVEDEQNLVVDDMANWKTYRNEEYGFEVQYPSDWTLNQQFSNTDGFFITKDKAAMAILPKGEFDHGLILNGKTIQQKLSGKDVVKTIVSGGIPIQYQFIDDTIPNTWNKCSVDLKNCNRIELTASNANDVDIFDQILSTFKFISTSTKIELNRDLNCKVYTMEYPGEGEVVKDCVLFGIKEGVSDTRIEEIIKEVGGIGYTRIPELGIWVVVLKSTENPVSNLSNTIKNLKSFSEVIYAEPNHTRNLNQ